MALKKELVAGGVANSTADAFGGTVTTGLTAFAGGGQASATPLTGVSNVVAVCATLADSVLLPKADKGDEIWVRNNGAASCNVFPRTGGAINGAAADAAFAVAAAKTAVFKCFGADTWLASLSA